MHSRAKTIVMVVFGLTVLGAAMTSPAAEDRGCFGQLDANRKAGEMVVGSSVGMTDLKLEGTASGGELTLLKAANANPQYITIQTQAGEPAGVVLARMAAAIMESWPFNPDSPPHVRAEGNLLKSFPGCAQDYAFAGTETGLGIPPPPTALSVSYDRDSQEFSLWWENPDAPYDAIGTNVHGGELAPTATTLTWKSPSRARPTPRTELERFRDRRDRALRTIQILGCRGGVVSNVAVITYDFDDNSQEELDSPPFTAGVHPNWKRWSHGGDAAALVLEQGTKGGAKRVEQMPKRPVVPDEKSFFQIIKTTSPEMTGGVYRKFLGLRPGHTYRLWTRMNTFDMDKVEGDWSFSFHAAAHGRTVALTPEQMAGTKPPPDGSVVGEVASFGPNVGTKGGFVERSTAVKANETQIGDITMPADGGAITVWFRYRGPACPGVGFDWIKLKDLTASQP